MSRFFIVSCLKKLLKEAREVALERGHEWTDSDPSPAYRKVSIWNRLKHSDIEIWDISSQVDEESIKNPYQQKGYFSDFSYSLNIGHHHGDGGIRSLSSFSYNLRMLRHEIGHIWSRSVENAERLKSMGLGPNNEVVPHEFEHRNTRVLD